MRPNAIILTALHTLFALTAISTAVTHAVPGRLERRLRNPQRRLPRVQEGSRRKTRDLRFLSWGREGAKSYFIGWKGRCGATVRPFVQGDPRIGAHRKGIQIRLKDGHSVGGCSIAGSSTTRLIGCDEDPRGRYTSSMGRRRTFEGQDKWLCGETQLQTHHLWSSESKRDGRGAGQRSIEGEGVGAGNGSRVRGDDQRLQMCDHSRGVEDEYLKRRGSEVRVRAAWPGTQHFNRLHQRSGRVRITRGLCFGSPSRETKDSLRCEGDIAYGEYCGRATLRLFLSLVSDRLGGYTPRASTVI
ncbi:hypothetical protein DFP72DRAFT_855376 [Ephemerocybe angulata]|uniref:Uncharacterized protein n=1 Tax=Ephemerocybe angulata TaxID=980116 RepID=A0A8H6HIT0_9AGAR|nr:hypothetical protein DFP72DRAFT_855376 [Tulosesus angulatus]